MLQVREGPLRREQLLVVVALALLTVAGWALKLSQMREMAAMGASRAGAHRGAMAQHPDMGGMSMSGTAMAEAVGPELGIRLLLYLGMWVSMMADLS